MKLIVCVKQVPDTAARIKIGAGGKEIDPSGLSYVVNPYDEYAVEEALRIKEKAGGEVVVISLGPERAVEAVRTALAMGADRGIHVKDAAFDKFEPAVMKQVIYIIFIPCAEIIKDNNSISFRQQLFRYIAPDKSGPAGNQYGFHTSSSFSNIHNMEMRFCR